MGQVLHGCATTTEAIRRAIQHSQESLRALAKHYGVTLKPSIAGASGYACVVGTVAHEPYLKLDGKALASLLEPGGLVADIKGMWRKVDLPDGLQRWQL